MKYSKYLLTILILLSTCPTISQDIDSVSASYVYEYVISRSKDDFSPNVLGSSFLISSMEKNYINTELVVRVGQRLAYSKLTRGNFIDFHPVWSKDGQWILFDSNREGKISIWKLSLSSDEPKMLLSREDKMCFAGQISNDGSRVLYNRGDFIDPAWWSFYIIPPRRIPPEKFKIYIRNLSKNTEKFLTTGILPVWNSKEKKVAFSDYVERKWHIWIMDLSTSQRNQLTKGRCNDFYPAWSPDDKWIAFAREDSIGTSDLCVINLQSLAVINLTKTPKINEGGPCWTPEGIYFHADNGENTPFDIVFISSEKLDDLLSISVSKPLYKREKAELVIKVLNSTRINGLAARTANLLKSKGYKIYEVGNTVRERNLYKGKVYYKPGYKEKAREIANIIPGIQLLRERKNMDTHIMVVLGRNTKY